MPRFPGLLFVAVIGLAAEIPPSPAELFRQAESALKSGDESLALNLADQAVAADAENPIWLQRRGELKFRMGRVGPSIEDFDLFLSKRPEQEPHHWQRGISYYYAGEFEKGVRQFEIHQTVNPHDVENAVWHFLCTARWKGVEAARAKLIPIEGDGRVPMMQVHALFAGRLAPQDVLDAAQAGQPSPRELHQRLFYAHLYLGLYHEALGEPEKSAEHTRLAVDRYSTDHYMGDVARVHARLRQAAADPQDGRP